MNVPLIISVITLAAILISMKLWLAPQFVAAYGVGGEVILIAAGYGIAVLTETIENRDP